MEKLAELAVIPVIFVVMTMVSYICSITVCKLFGFGPRPRNFVIAMGVFGNSNSLPISLVISLSQTLKGLHWDKVPGDNDDEVAARGILYLLIFQQLGQLVRWSWGYHVLLAPPETYHEDTASINSRTEEGRYRDEPEEDDEDFVRGRYTDNDPESRQAPKNSDELLGGSRTESEFESGGVTPVNRLTNTNSKASSASTSSHNGDNDHIIAATPANGNVLPENALNGNGDMVSFPTIQSIKPDTTPKTIIAKTRQKLGDSLQRTKSAISGFFSRSFAALPKPIQKALSATGRGLVRFFKGVWAFMNPPLWAMLAAILVAAIPDLQSLFFSEGTFISNSVTRAISQSGGVAVPLILVVLGANLARNTLPKEDGNTIADGKEDTKLLVASILSRMFLPTLFIAPMLALAAKFVPVSILDDPIFVIVCFLLTGAPSALQLAQICQINGVYESAMSRLLFQSYVIW
jgi:auxin efflux carrier family protein